MENNATLQMRSQSHGTDGLTEVYCKGLFLYWCKQEEVG